jgi:hypothetical protein
MIQQAKWIANTWTIFFSVGSKSIGSLLGEIYMAKFKIPPKCPPRQERVKTSTFTSTNWQNYLNPITITTSFFLRRFFSALANLGMMWRYESSIDCFLSGLLRAWLIIWGVCESCGTTWVWYYTCSRLMRWEQKELPKTNFLEGSSTKQGWINMCDISHAIHAKCGTAHKTGK